MNNIASAVRIANMIRSRGIRKPGARYSRFSGPGGAMCAHGKMWERPAVMISTRNTKATGKNATYTSANRITSRDHRAVVIRCTATNVTAAAEMSEKYHQLRWNARHARSGSMNRDAMNTTAPVTAAAMAAVRTPAGVGRAASAASSEREG